MILTGVDIFAIPIDGGWLEIDTPTDLDLASSIVNEPTGRIFLDVVDR